MGRGGGDDEEVQAADLRVPEARALPSRAVDLLDFGVDVQVDAPQGLMEPESMIDTVRTTCEIPVQRTVYQRL
jgi:hypothetical protein